MSIFASIVRKNRAFFQRKAKLAVEEVEESLAAEETPQLSEEEKRLQKEAWLAQFWADYDRVENPEKYAAQLEREKELQKEACIAEFRAEYERMEKQMQEEADSLSASESSYLTVGDLDYYLTEDDESEDEENEVEKEEDNALEKKENAFDAMIKKKLRLRAKKQAIVKSLLRPQQQ